MARRKSKAVIIAASVKEAEIIANTKLAMATLYVPPSLNAVASRDYGVELRIGNGPWYSTGVLCESPTQAESVGAMLAKFWLGVAKSRVVSPKEESADELDEIDRAELHRVWVDNIAVNHD